jgi:hypothetical protein
MWRSETKLAHFVVAGFCLLYLYAYMDGEERRHISGVLDHPVRSLLGGLLFLIFGVCMMYLEYHREVPYRHLRVTLAAALMVFLVCTSLIRETQAPHKYAAILTFSTLLLLLLMWFLACRQWTLGLLAVHYALLTIALLHEMHYRYGDGVALYEFLSIFVVIIACVLLPS